MLFGNARSEFFELKSEGRGEQPLGEGGEYSLWGVGIVQECARGYSGGPT